MKCVGSVKERRGDGEPRKGHLKIDKSHPKASGTLDRPLIGTQGNDWDRSELEVEGPQFLAVPTVLCCSLSDSAKSDET